MEPYLIFSYSIKWENVGFLKIAMREVAIILQAPSAKKPKYARKMLCQIHILDTKVADSILQNAYIPNTLINLQDLLFTFYKMDLLFEHQNRKFKRFWTDLGFSL